jgi:hypothetical protein
MTCETFLVYFEYFDRFWWKTSIAIMTWIHRWSAELEADRRRRDDGRIARHRGVWSERQWRCCGAKLRAPITNPAVYIIWINIKEPLICCKVDLTKDAAFLSFSFFIFLLIPIKWSVLLLRILKVLGLNLGTEICCPAGFSFSFKLGHDSALPHSLKLIIY